MGLAAFDAKSSAVIMRKAERIQAWLLQAAPADQGSTQVFVHGRGPEQRQHDLIRFPGLLNAGDTLEFTGIQPKNNDASVGHMGFDPFAGELAFQDFGAGVRTGIAEKTLVVKHLPGRTSIGNAGDREG